MPKKKAEKADDTKVLDVTPPTAAAEPQLAIRRILARFDERVPVKLTAEELHATGKRVARVCLDLADHEGVAKAAKKQLDARKSALEEERANLCTLLRDEAELRPVECILEAYYTAKLARTIRQDTGEVVRTRTLESSEAQKDLFDHAAEEGDGKPAEKKTKPEGPPRCEHEGCAIPVNDAHLCEVCNAFICDTHSTLAVHSAGHEPKAHWEGPK